MRTHAQLCHVSTDHFVVLVEAYEGTTPLGSALGEGCTATDAEDQALVRLQARLDSSEPFKTEQAAQSDTTETIVLKPDEAAEVGVIKSALGERSKASAPVRRAVPLPPSEASEPTPQHPQPRQIQQGTAHSGNDSTKDGSTVDVPASLERGADPQPPSEAPTDPEDWSEELTAIDLELQRVGWDRDSEKIYLERAFGHASRHRLTRFSDLVAYLKRLRDLSQGSDPQVAAIPLRRSDLVMQGDEILERLQWSQQQAKDFLNQHHKASSRQQLSDEQLLSFNMKLEEQLLEQ